MGTKSNYCAMSLDNMATHSLKTSGVGGGYSIFPEIIRPLFADIT